MNETTIVGAHPLTWSVHFPDREDRWHDGVGGGPLTPEWSTGGVVLWHWRLNWWRQVIVESWGLCPRSWPRSRASDKRGLGQEICIHPSTLTGSFCPASSSFLCEASPHKTQSGAQRSPQHIWTARVLNYTV